MLDKGFSGNEHQVPDQVQPRGAEHGPEGQQENERAVGLSGSIGILPGGFFACLLHGSKDRQKETKP